MNSPKIIFGNVIKKDASLRQKAEEHLKVNKSTKSSLSGLSTELTELSFLKEPEGETDTIRLLHELEVHQIELEMQNEELKLAVEKAAIATALYDFAPAGYFTLNREGVICQMNLSGANLLGKDRSRLIDSHFSQFLSPESLPVFNDFFRNIFQTNTKQVCELWFLLQEKSSLFIHLEGIVAENPEKCLLTAVNITERKRAEQIITESEANLNSLVNNRDESIWSIDSGYNFVIFNKFFLDEYFASFNIELKKGMNALENVSPKLSELWKQKYDTALRGKRVYFEYSNHVGKELHYYEVFLNPIISEGKITGVSALSANISYRKRAEKALHRSEIKYRKLHESMMDGFVYVGMDGRIREFNESYLRMLEYSPNEITQLSYTDITPEKWKNYEMEIVENQVLLRGYSEVYEKEYRKKNGTVFPVELRTVLYKNEHGKNEGMWAIVRDITERKRAEEALKQSEARLQELNATKDKFFSIIAHDLKNPFNSIIGFSNILARQIYENNYEGIAKYGMIIQNSSQRAMDLLMNLLEWSRIQTESIAFNPECIEIEELTNSVLKSLIDSANQKTIKISIEFSPLVFVFADKEMISTVLRNLISNAIKFTHPGGEIVISTEKKQTEWMITIADNGVGIKTEAIDKLFRIDQSYSTMGTQNEKGTGLGLLLCKEFVEKNGGRIWVESGYGGSHGSCGSKFHFTVPKG